MEKRLFKKGLVIAIIVLFVGAGVIPAISGDIGNVETDKKEIGTSKNVIFLGKLGDAPKPTWDIGQIWRYEVNTLNINQFGVSLNADPFNLQIEVTEKTTSLYKLSFEGVMTADISINIGDVTISGRLINTEIDGWFSIDNDDLGITKVEFSVTGTIDRGPGHIIRYIPFNVQSGVEPRNVYNFFYFPICEGETWNVPSEEFDISIIFKIKFLGLWHTIIDDTGEITIDGHNVECVGVETVNGLEAYHVQGIGDYWYSPSIENIVKLYGSYAGFEIDMEYCPQPFYFVHITDTHLGYDGARNRFQDCINDIIGSDPKPDFVIVSGDLISWGADSDCWWPNPEENSYTKFKDDIDDLETNGIEYFCCPGNHDYYMWPYGCIGLGKYHDKINPNDRYSFTWKNTHIISINSGCDSLLSHPFYPPKGSGLSDDDINWIENDLDSLDDVINGRDDSGLNKIIFMHHPTINYMQGLCFVGGLYPIVPCVSWDTACIHNNRNTFKQKICEDYNVDVVLSGHTHESGSYLKGDDGVDENGLSDEMSWDSNLKMYYIPPKDETIYAITASVVDSYVSRLVVINGSEVKVYDDWPHKSIVNANLYGCPAILHLYDSHGNHIGRNETGGVDFEIENATYSYIPFNETGNMSNWNHTIESISMLFGFDDYIISINATEEGLFHFSIERHLINGSDAKAFYENVSVIKSSKGKLFVYNDSINYTIHMDDNGDGIVDRYIEPTTIITNPPIIPARPEGPTNGKPEVEYTYTTSTIDPDGDKIYYLWDWGDGNMSDWLGPYESGEKASAKHTWDEKGTYSIRVKAKDDYDCESGWSDLLPVTMPKNQQSNNQQNSQSVGFQQSSSQLSLQILERLMNRLPPND